jgi:hypothetical protein
MAIDTQTIKTLTELNLGKDNQATFTNDQFADKFKQTTGRAPTQEELYNFHSVKSQLRGTGPLVSSDQAASEIESPYDPLNRIDAEKKRRADQAAIEAQAVAENPVVEPKIPETDYDRQVQANTEYYQSEINNVNTTFDRIHTDFVDGSDALISSIKDIYEQRAKEMETLNKAKLSGATKIGIRSGRNRYAPLIEQGILTAEEQAGMDRITKLGVEEAQLIAEAKIAKANGEWKMFNEKRTALTELHKDKLSALSNQLDFTYKTEQLANLQQSNALDRLKAVASVGGTIDPGLANQIDSVYGEGFSNKYTEVVKLEKEVSDKETAIDLLSKLNDLRNDYPLGEEFTLGDTTYTGLASDDPDFSIWKVTDDLTGVEKVIKYNQSTNEITTTDTGVVTDAPGGGSGDGSVTPGGTTQIEYKGGTITVPTAFVGNIGDDYMVNTDIYKQERAKLKTSTARTLFDENYRFLLNPSDFTAVDLALPKTYSDEQQDALQAALGENWFNKGPQEKLDALTKYEAQKRKDLGIGQSNTPSYGGKLDDEEDGTD